MSDPSLDIVGIGNAIVDVISHVEEKALEQHGLIKASMQLVDEPTSARLYAALGQTAQISGGSAANTIVGAALLGSRTAFVGKVAADDLGEAFAHDIRAAGVYFDTRPASAEGGPSTARCVIMVTPDGERTMSTYLGAAQDLKVSDIDQTMIASAAVTYLEGYLWDPPAAKEAFLAASKFAHGARRKVALTLSDTFCVVRYRDEFRQLIDNREVDIVFANEGEAKALFDTPDGEEAIAELGRRAGLAVITRGGDGAVVIEGETRIAVPAFTVPRLVDTTGAGDLFAAGFLHGYAKGFAHADSARLGTLAAAEIISHTGARPEGDLKALAAANGVKI